MIYLFNQNQDFLDEISKEDIISANEEKVLNGKITSNIIIPYKRIQELEDKVRYYGYKTNSNFFLYKIIKKKKEKNVLEYQGVHILFEDLQGRVITDKRFKNKTIKEIADVIFDKTDWNVISYSENKISTSFYRISALDAFYKILKIGCEYRVDITFLGMKLQKNIYFEDIVSKDYGKWFEYGDKLLSVVEEQNHSNIYTGFIGLGKGEVKTDESGEITGGYGRKITFSDIEWKIEQGDPADKPLGQDYIEIPEMTKLFGYPNNKPKITYVDFPEIEEKEKLLKETYKYALQNSRPKLQLKANAFTNEKVEIGEICTIIRDDLKIRYKTRIFNIKTNLINNIQTFEFRRRNSCVFSFKA